MTKHFKINLIIGLVTYKPRPEITNILICFLQGYFDTARLELAEHNIHVQTVLPGPVESNISRYVFTENISDVRELIFS